MDRVSDERLGRFGYHPDPAIDFEIEVQSLEARLFDAKGGISKPGTEPEAIAAVLDAIGRAMTFRVGADPSAVLAKQALRRLEDEARDALTELREHRASAGRVAEEWASCLTCDGAGCDFCGYTGKIGTIVRALQAQPASQEGDDDHEDQWRELALQFDGHRMQALSLLRGLVDGATTLSEAKSFLASPPLSGEQVLAQRLASLAARSVGTVEDDGDLVEAPEPRGDAGEVVAWIRMNPQRTSSTGVTDVAFCAYKWAEAGDVIEPLVRKFALDAERAKSAYLLVQAQGHAQEARTANHTIYQIYQVLSGGRGEPGNWHGAEPARKYVVAAGARIKELEAVLEPFAKAATVIAADLSDQALLFAHYPSVFGGQTEIRVGDLRQALAARALLEKQGGAK